MSDEPTDQPEEIQRAVAQPEEMKRSVTTTLVTELLSDAAQVLGPMAGAYTGYKLAHQDKPEAETPPPPVSEQPDQLQDPS